MSLLIIFEILLKASDLCAWRGWARCTQHTDKQDMVIFTWKHTEHVGLVMMCFEMNGMRASTFGELIRSCACAGCQANERALNWSLLAHAKRNPRQTDKTEITLNNFESYLRYHIFQPFLTVAVSEWVRWEIVIFCDVVARGPNPCALKYSSFFSYFPFNVETKQRMRKKARFCCWLWIFFLALPGIFFAFLFRCFCWFGNILNGYCSAERKYKE